VLFIQTWNDDKKAGPLNPRVEDYAVFLATSEESGKDNSGDYIYRYGPDNAPMLDNHNHMIVEHDLDEIAGEFVKWGRQHKLAFCDEGD
jgi:type I restriction enzyme M protein